MQKLPKVKLASFANGSHIEQTNATGSDTTDSIVICWDPPAEGKDSVECYELFYRPETDSGWTMLKRDIQNTCVTVYRSDVDTSQNRIFYFGVRSVGKNGLKSDFNFSSDEDWFYNWD